MNCHSVFNCSGHNHELTSNRLIKETVLSYVNEAEFKELFTMAALEKIETVTTAAITATSSAVKASLDARSAVNDLTVQTIDFVNDAINNTAIEGGVLADTFVTITPNGYGSIARSLREVKSERISVKDFGAKGDGNQTLIDITPYTTDLKNGSTISKQTADGIAINKAIVYLRGKGGGALHIPAGVYYTYGYLEPIDFSCVIYGDGASSVLKNCDASPTHINGYGILHIDPKNYEEVSLLNFKTDGNAHVRTKPTNEFRNYPIGVYTRPKLIMYGITSVNSPIDCFMTTYYDNDINTYVKAVNCVFADAFRNTVSLVGGWNQQYTNCSISGGGYVHGGTNPRYTIDIEPNVVGRSVENIQFNTCWFGRAVNVVVGGVWSAVQFDNCIFDGSDVHPINANKKTYPWVFQLTEGNWHLNNCKFIGRDDYMQNACHHFNSFSNSSRFGNAQYLKISNSTWDKCGVNSTSRSIDIRNCSGQNSLHPFLFQGGSKTDNAEVYIRGLRLTNVFDGDNHGRGSESAFIIKADVSGNIDIDDVTVDIDVTSLDIIGADKFVYPRYYGVFIDASLANTNKRKVNITNVYSGGFYKRLPTYLGLAENSSSYRDWRTPTSAPADTVLSSRTIGNIGTYYRNCLMWGNHA